MANVPIVDGPVVDGPVLDLAFLDTLAADLGDDGTAEVVRIFLEDAPPRIVRMRDASCQGDTVVRREAHALSGSAHAIGLVRLGEAASALQRATEAGTADPAASADLAVLLRQGVTALQAWLAARGALT